MKSTAHKIYTMEEAKNPHSHSGNTYITSAAVFADEMIDDRTVLRQIRYGKETCDQSAADKGTKVKYYHITVSAVFEGDNL